MRMKLTQLVSAGVLAVLMMAGVDAHAGDDGYSIAQSGVSSTTVGYLQNYVWDFSLSSSIRAGKTAPIGVVAWSEDNGTTTSSLNFYLSKDYQLDVNRDKLIGQMTINLAGSGNGGQNESFFGTVKIPPRTKPGNYFFFLTIDGRERTIRGEYFSQKLKIKKK